MKGGRLMCQISWGAGGEGGEKSNKAVLQCCNNLLKGCKDVNQIKTAD